MGNVYFLSQQEAERLAPVSSAAMISITDPDKPLAQLGQWDYLLRESFYDGGYSRETIHTMKETFPFKYASYIDSEQAHRLVAFLDCLIQQGVREIYVHCYYGRSRSGAVAMFLRDKYGFTPNKEIDRPNRTVYKMLQNPQRYDELIACYAKKATIVPGATSFIGKLRAFLGL
ncbi:hypothetical protein EGT81_19535 [Alcaligenes faecalis]|uniref:hypothetical protein n=1 Tax=Alcaligenes faecalis TaxID=511 RepID=UPI000F685996|nr:hypothetical protein [Alcaligenes faecalis]RSE57630.1 hypothetical protein EGT81_19535 [Alcaligenes faecalis]